MATKQANFRINDAKTMPANNIMWHSGTRPVAESTAMAYGAMGSKPPSNQTNIPFPQRRMSEIQMLFADAGSKPPSNQVSFRQLEVKTVPKCTESTHVWAYTSSHIWKSHIECVKCKLAGLTPLCKNKCGELATAEGEWKRCGRKCPGHQQLTYSIRKAAYTIWEVAEFKLSHPPVRDDGFKCFICKDGLDTYYMMKLPNGKSICIFCKNEYFGSPGELCAINRHKTIISNAINFATGSKSQNTGSHN
jgi:hypothetical protein